jgi:hypothetical protein
MIPNDCEEALLTFVRHPESGGEAKALSAGDLLHELNARGFRGSVFNAVNIGKVMRRLKFNSIIKHGVTKYIVVLADYTCQEREQKEDAIHAAEDVGTPGPQHEEEEHAQEQKLPM